MISDGVSQSFEDATWLFEAMAKPHSGSVGEYLDLLVGEARKNCLSTDDMTVAVAKISLLGQSA